MKMLISMLNVDIDNDILHMFLIGFCPMKMLISMLNIDTLIMLF